ncbi:MAG: branched-chain amino acid ABC transporter ATP-binding protein/permease [Anaerolineae bacterium]|nr:branched-chain amino acid ABC transporter ATP-binding protein/permease [Anaerolineae bacterium]
MNRITKIALGFVIVAVVFLPQLVNNNYILRLGILAGIFIMLASAHNLLMKVGQLSLGPVAFYGLGAYISAILSTRYHVPFLICFLIAGVAAALAGWGIGRLTLKMRTAYFVLVTIGFAEFFRLVALNWTDMTNGPMGITAIPAPAPWFKGYNLYYYFVLILVGLVLFVLYRLENSATGRAMLAIRENEVLGQSVGIDSYRYMMQAAVLSSFIIGLAGSFYAHFFQFIGPEILGFELTITIVVMVIAGGRATLAGPVLGAILFTIIPEVLRAATMWRMVIYGLLLVFIMLFTPDGVMPALVKGFQKLLELIRRRNSRSQKEVSADQESILADGLSNLVATINSSSAAEAAKQYGNAPVLEVDNLSVYFGGVHAVEKVCFSVNPGEILAIIGPNGAGKTTLLNAITRLGPITSGVVRYKGEEITSLSAHEIAKKHIVRTFQHTSVFRRVSTRRNLLLAHNGQEPNGILVNLLQTRELKQLEEVGRQLAEEILKFTGLERYGDYPANALPYGDQRLLELGIALGADPHLLLLDEPAAGMNPTEVDNLMVLIRRIRDMGITVVLVEHDMKLVMGISDRIIVLHHGKQIAMGTPNEIKRDEVVVNAYLGKVYKDVETVGC